MSEAPEAMEFMREARHRGKLVLTVPLLAGGRLREDRCYLVTGGMGELGLKVAERLVAGGAGTVVLCGRGGPDAEAAAQIESLGAQGATVVVERADVSDATQVEALVGRIRNEHGELAGIVHCAGVLADAALDNHTRETLEQVFEPKVDGAWHLHRTTLDLDLDMFVLFSSMAGVTGSPGQANYAAANAWLDQLARHRRAIGLSAQSIAWGPWAEIGLAARVERDGAPASPMGKLSPVHALEAFDQLLRNEPVASAVADVDWRSLGPAIPDLPFFEEVLKVGARQPGARTSAIGDGIVARLTVARPGERTQLLESLLKEEVASVLQLPEPPPSDVGFFDLGMDSLTAVELSSRLNRALFGVCKVGRTVAFDHPDVRSLTAHLAEALDLGEAKPPAPRRGVRRMALGDDPVAIVGMACRFPKAENLAAFRHLLTRGRSGIDQFPSERLGEYKTVEDLPPEARFGGFIDGIDRFDAPFFRIAPVEAKAMDPQQRFMLETTWEALEDAGIDPAGLRGEPVGVYAGISTTDYKQLIADTPDGLNRYAPVGTSPSVAIGRIAFTLGLEGPAMAVDTACSSSLVAVHQAVAALQRGEAEMTLAGGVNLVLLPIVTAAVAGADMLSADGQCKTFDASADGIVRGEGCGMLALKRLADAEADGDRIWAVIRGSAINQDGASAGLTVPSGTAQERVIRQALERAQLEPADLEAHGTGTSLGDPIEVRSAAAVYGEGRPTDRPLLLGSAKTNVGHLEAAAGVAGLIKAVLAIRSPVVFRNLNFEEPNPHIEWDDLPVKVVSQAFPWPDANGRPRRAAVSSFGFSGTNSHVILEGYGEPERPEPVGSAEPVGAGVRPDGADSRDGVFLRDARAEVRVASPGETADGVSAEGFARRQRLLPLSGRSETAVRQLAERYLAWLDRAENDDRGGSLGGGRDDLLADMAFTAAVGRSHFDHRATVVFSGADGPASAGVPLAPDGLADALRRIAAGEGISRAHPAPRVAFMFSPVGGQWPGMGRDLYDEEPRAREVLERCAAVMKDLRPTPLLDAMFGEANEDGAAPDLTDPAWNQPTLYALASAIVGLWAQVGVRPQAAIGHSFGEIVAAHAAGAYSLEDGMRLAALRGALIGTTDKAGSMAAVFAPPDVLAGALERFPAVHLAADNGTHQVVSGLADEVARLTDHFRRADVRVEPLSTGAAGHSSLMDPILHELEEAASTLSASPPAIDLVSNVTGKPWPQGSGPDGAYWRRHVREPVAFASGLKSLAATGANVLVEIGPEPALAGIANAVWPLADPPALIASLGARTNTASFTALARPGKRVFPSTSAGCLRAKSGAASRSRRIRSSANATGSKAPPAGATRAVIHCWERNPSWATARSSTNGTWTRRASRGLRIIGRSTGS